MKTGHWKWYIGANVEVKFTLSWGFVVVLLFICLFSNCVGLIIKYLCPLSGEAKKSLFCLLSSHLIKQIFPQMLWTTKSSIFGQMGCVCDFSTPLSTSGLKLFLILYFLLVKGLRISQKWKIRALQIFPMCMHRLPYVYSDFYFK